MSCRDLERIVVRNAGSLEITNAGVTKVGSEQGVGQGAAWIRRIGILRLETGAVGQGVIIPRLKQMPSKIAHVRNIQQCALRNSALYSDTVLVNRGSLHVFFNTRNARRKEYTFRAQ